MNCKRLKIWEGGDRGLFEDIILYST